MHMKKWLGLFVVAFGLIAATGASQAAPAFKPLAQPQAVESGDRIEVIEFFWYGCPHCFDLEPVLKKWTAALPKDVEFRRIPAVPTQRWMHDARIFYTLEALDLLDKMHGAVFDAIHLNSINLGDEKTLVDWMASQGVDRTRFSSAWKSFSVQSKTKRAIQLTQAYDINSVPMLIVDGKYVTSVSMAGSMDALLKTLDELVAKARAERPKKK